MEYLAIISAVFLIFYFLLRFSGLSPKGGHEHNFSVPYSQGGYNFLMCDKCKLCEPCHKNDDPPKEYNRWRRWQIGVATHDLISAEWETEFVYKQNMDSAQKKWSKEKEKYYREMLELVKQLPETITQ